MAILLMVAVGLYAFGTGSMTAAELTDAFESRQLLVDDSGQISGSNVGASIEDKEPRHAGKSGGRSVWISWIAPTNGIATFRTAGSSFDTLLAAYYFKQTNDTTLDELELAASNDDDELAPPTSTIQFGAEAGVRYEIAVDGFSGSSGDINLEWQFTPIETLAPVIVNMPEDRALRLGDPLTLTVNIQTTPDIRLQWRFNGNSIGAEGPTLFIPSLDVANVGRYSMRIRIGSGGDEVRFETSPVEIQVNSDGQTNALARDKLFDALDSPLVPDDHGGGGGALRAAGDLVFTAAAVGVSRGYNGTQVFNTTYATADPSEPRHCGLAGSATYWYAYTPPADGTLVLDTIGSSFDTFIAVYTYNPPLTGYADLIPLVCDNDGAGTNGAARLEVAVPKGGQFIVVLDGIDGARGIARLNYHLDTNRPPVAPTLVQAPAHGDVASGMNVTLQPAIAGSPPMHFVWRKGTNILAGATNSILELGDVTPAESGEYWVTAFSHVGAPLEVLMPLRVLVPPRLECQPLPEGSWALSFTSAAGQSYVLESTDDLAHPWRALTESYSGDGSVIVLTNIVRDLQFFYRLRVE